MKGEAMLLALNMKWSYSHATSGPNCAVIDSINL